MPPRSTVSVVMPTYGKLENLAETLASLSRQTYPMDLIEVVVVDDCSADDTPAFLEALEPPFKLVAVRHEENRGRAAARNTAIRAAGNDLVVFVDDDMRCDEGLIEAHVAFHETHDRAVAIGDATQAPELGRSTIYTYLDGTGVRKLAPGGRSPARYFVTNNSSVARADLLAVGLFDESFKNYGFEDTEIAFRLENDAGLKFWYCAEAISHHVHRQTLDQVLDKRFETAEPLLALLERHPGRAGELSVAGLLPPAPGDPFPLAARKLVLRFVTNRPVSALVRAVARSVHLGPLSRPAVLCLIAGAYRRGLAAALERRAR